MFRTVTAAALLSLTVAVMPAAADEAPLAGSPTMVIPAGISRSLSRPKVLPAMYASYAALQVFDVMSTQKALALGAREANPLIQGVVGHAGAFWAVKVGVAAGTIVAAERLWKTNKVAAIAVMAAGNGVAAIVASRNARVLRNLR